MKSRLIGLLFGLVSAMPGALLSSAASASAVMQESIETLLRQADFVFEGVVVDVRHRFSEKRTEDEYATPYTFVSYRVLSVIKGSYAGSVLTLRFFGGPVNDDEFMMMSGMPLFDVGDHDLLLVQGNNYLLCPLVNCVQGRFRYINGLVVNESGQTIHLDEDGAIRYGQSVELEEINTNKMSGSITLTREQVNTSAEGGTGPVPITQVERTFLPDTAGFTALVQQNVLAVHSAEELASLPNFETADPDKKFTDEQAEKLYQPVASQSTETEGESVPESEQIELMLKQTIDEAKRTMSTEEQQELFVKLAEQYPQFRFANLITDKSKLAGAGKGNADVSAVTAPDPNGSVSGGHVLKIMLFFLLVSASIFLGWRVYIKQAR